MMAKIAWLFCALIAQAHAADTQSHKFSRDVISPAAKQQVLLALPLDAQIYAASTADFGDLRLIDAAGVETPFLLQKIAGQKTVIKRIPSRSAKPGLQKQGEKGIVINLDLKDDEPSVDGLTLFTQQRDFEYVLQVQGSDDAQNWHTLVDNALIYDYSRFMSIGNRDVNLPANSYKHFKIVVDKAIDPLSAERMELTRTLRGEEELQRTEKVDVHHQPLHIERIELWHNQVETIAESEQRFDYPLSGFTVSQDEDRQVTLLDIAAQNQPLTGLKLSIATPNYSRLAEVQIPFQQGIETRMHSLGSSRLEGLHFQDIQREQNQLNFQENRQQRYRIVIHNQDNPPLAVNNVSGIGPAYQILFVAEPGLSYQLLYGSDKNQTPQYDTAPIKELLRKGYQSMAGQLGPQIDITAESTGFEFSKLLNSNLFLGLVIGLMVLVLGWSLFKVGKRVGDL